MGMSDGSNRYQPFYAGTSTFFRSRTGVPADLRRGDCAILGAPFDASGALSRPGARFGPKAVREASCYYASFYYGLPDHKFVDIAKQSVYQVPEVLPLYDLGDIDCHPMDVQLTTQMIADRVGEVVAAGAFPITIGGDHYIAYPSFKGVAEAIAKRNPGAKIGYLHIDSHNDLEDEVSYAGKFNHITSARRISEHPGISISHMAWLGLNGNLMSVETYDFAQEHNLIFVSSEQLSAPDWDQRVGDVIRHVAECDYVYVSFDIDVVDGAHSPGTGAVVFDGIHPVRFLQLCELISKIDNLAGIDLCEVSPAYDPSGRTVRLAALGLVTFLSERMFIKVAKDSADEQDQQ